MADLQLTGGFAAADMITDDAARVCHFDMNFCPFQIPHPLFRAALVSGWDDAYADNMRRGRPSIDIPFSSS
jgi:hypothetical protein